MKAAKKIILTITITLMAVFSLNFPVNAQNDATVEATQFSQFMTATESLEVKETPDNSAQTIFSYEPGATIYVTGEENGWYVVLYQGKTGYLNKSTSEKSLQKTEIDIEALDAEMEQEQIESKMIVEETERQRAEARRSKIWGAVIVLLVLGIFATGIVSTIQAEKKRKDIEEEVLDLDKVSDI